MSEEANNPYAFPCDIRMAESGVLYESTGMTLRDYFAAKAMPITMQEHGNDWEVHAFEQPTFLQWAAETAYEMADAMLEARGK